MNNYTGKQIGQYIVLSKCTEKANDGHSLYNGKCIKCGYIRSYLVHKNQTVLAVGVSDDGCYK